MDQEAKQHADQIRRFEQNHNLSATETSLNLWVSGNTKPYSQSLRSLGMEWAQKRAAWYWQIPSSKSGAISLFDKNEPTRSSNPSQSNTQKASEVSNENKPVDNSLLTDNDSPISISPEELQALLIHARKKEDVSRNARQPLREFTDNLAASNPECTQQGEQGTEVSVSPDALDQNEIGFNIASTELRGCSRLEAKCVISLLLKIPYDLNNALTEAGFTYMGDLVGINEDQLLDLVSVSRYRASLLVDRVEEQGVKFPIDCPSMKQDKQDDFYTVLIDSAYFPQDLSTTSLNNPELHVTPGLGKRLREIGINQIGDLVGVPDSELLSQKGVGEVALKKLRVSIAKYASRRGLGDPTQPGRGYTSQTAIDSLGSNQEVMHLAQSQIMPLAKGVVLSDWQLSLALKDFGLAPTMKRALAGLGYSTIRDLLGEPLDSLLEMDSIGPRAVAKMRQALADKGIPIVGYFAASTPSNSQNKESFLITAERINLVGPQYTPSSQAQEILFNSEKGFYTYMPIGKPTNLRYWLAESIPQAINCNALTAYDSINIADLAKRDLESNFSFTKDLLKNDGDGQIQGFLSKKQTATSDLIPSCMKNVSVRMVYGLVFRDVALMRDISIGDALKESAQSVGLSYLCELVGNYLHSSYALASQAQNSSQLVNQLIFDAYPRATELYVTTYKERHGIGFQKRTLQKIAENNGLTRERIRQMAKKVEDRIHPNSNIRFLIPRILVISEVANDTCESENRENRSAADSFIDDIGLFLPLCDEVAEEDGSPHLTAKCDACAKCEALEEFLNAVNSDGELASYDEMIKTCNCINCRSLFKPTGTTIKGFGKIELIDGYVGSTNNPVIRSLKKPDSDRAAIAAILYQSPEPLNYDKLVELFRNNTGRDLSKARAMSHMGSIDDSIFWGRGTYLHKRFVPNPVDLIDQIKARIMELFRDHKVPILGVGGVFGLFQDELVKEGIPGEQALYSLVRLQNYSELKLQEYPWICLDETIGDRTSFAKYFYSILTANNGFITDAHAEAIAQRTMAQSFALGGLAEYSPFLINANGGWYDIEAAGFDMDGIAELMVEVAAKMRDDDIISAAKVFDDYKARCYSLGVKSYDILYYLVDMIEDDLPIEATRKPHFVKSQRKGLSVRAIARKYIRESEKPVSRLELINEFGVRRGINASGLSEPVLLGEGIVLVGNDTYWSQEAMGLDASYLEYFDNAVASKIGFVRKVANLFYPVASIASNFEGVEPPRGVRWNKKVLRTVFSKSARYRLFGETSGCVVDLDANPDAISVEAFYVELLNNEFMSWSPFDTFASYCSIYGIRRDLEPEFFDAFDSIEADEFSIQVKQ